MRPTMWLSCQECQVQSDDLARGWRAHPLGRPALTFGTLGRKYMLTRRPVEHLQVIVGELEAGGSTGDEPYTHGDSEDLLVVLAGIVSLQLGTEIFELSTAATPRR